MTGASLVGVLFVVTLSAAPGQIWSPYYRINKYDADGELDVNVNGIPHQAL